MQITDLDLEELRKLKQKRFTGTIRIEMQNGEFGLPEEVEEERKAVA